VASKNSVVRGIEPRHRPLVPADSDALRVFCPPAIASRIDGSSVRCEKSHKFCHLLWPIWAAQRNTAQHLHQFLPGRCVVALIFVGHALNHSRCGIGFDEARRNGDDANLSGADFIRQDLASAGLWPGTEAGESVARTIDVA